MKKDVLPHCGQTIRDHDRDRFLLSLRAPAAKREALWALFAFNYEIAKTRAVVTETQLGHIRLQWWRDNISALYEGKEPSSNPVLSALATAIKTHDLPQADFDALIYAREFDLENVPPAHMEGLEHYADFTTTPLHRMALQILGQDVAANILRDVSTGYALAGLLRAIPFHTAQGRNYMPDKVTVADICAHADMLLRGGRGAKGFTGTAARLGLYYTAKLQKTDFDVQDVRGQSPPMSFIIKEFFRIV